MVVVRRMLGESKEVSIRVGSCKEFVRRSIQRYSIELSSCKENLEKCKVSDCVGSCKRFC